MLGLRQAVALGIGGTVGGGIFVLVGEAAGEAGPAALPAFALGFLAALTISLPYAELSCRYPAAGGGYAFVRTVLGERAGFLMGWGYWGAYLFLSIFITLGFGGYLEALAGVDRVAGAVALVAGCSVLNMAGVRVSGGVQVAVIAAAVGGLVAFAVWGLPAVDLERLDPPFPRGAGALFTAALLAFLAFGGFDMIAAAGEEVEAPERNLPRAILLTLVAVLALYLTVALVALGTLGWQELGSSPAPLADAAQRFSGDPGRALATAVALLTTAATANAVLVVTSRISYAMARDGLLPGALTAVGGRLGAPWASVALNGALIGLLALIGSVELGTAAGGFLYVLHFVPPLVALVILRRRGGAPPRFETPLPRLVLPLALGGCGVLLAASGPTGVAIGGGWLALGFLGYTVARQGYWAGMSSENVEVVRRLFETYGRGDFVAAQACLDPDVVYETGQELPAFGPAAVRAMWERWEGAWEEIQTVPMEFVDAGEHVVVTVHYSARGRGSGIEYDEHLFDVYTLRDGRCVRKLEFRERSEALEAAGLPDRGQRT